MDPNGKRACCFAIFPFRFETRVFVVAFFVVASLALAPQAGAQSTVPDVTEEFFTLVGGVAQPYTTRMLGRQPKNPKRFSGIVLDALEADIPRRPHP